MKRLVTLAVLLLVFMGSKSYAATLTYVGSWTVDQGPAWSTVPPAYSGQEAAALLFGGSPSDYAISTVSADPADVNFDAWVSTWGGACGGPFPCGTIFAQNYVVSTGGLYVSPGDTSAYVFDWAQGSQYTNYAFSGYSPVPEPGSLFLLGTGIVALAGAIRRKRTA
jgi:hypothetical protein